MSNHIRAKEETHGSLIGEGAGASGSGRVATSDADDALGWLAEKATEDSPIPGLGGGDARLIRTRPGGNPWRADDGPSWTDPWAD
jgi:hypothetical protein